MSSGGGQGRAALTGGRKFLAAAAMLFIASVGATIHGARSMAGPMAMPGGGTLPMGSTVMPGHSRVAAAAAFEAMWLAMMVAMMLPALLPALWRYRGSVSAQHPARAGGLTALAGIGYLSVWAACGAAIYAVAAPLAAETRQWPTLAGIAPLAGGVALLAAGAVQLTNWKLRQLACCRHVITSPQRDSGRMPGAYRAGLRLGLHCALCCAGYTTLLLVIGMERLGVAAVAAAAITAERVAPSPRPVARAAGLVIIAAGVLRIVQGWPST
jgi:predicted metal-binding membrane protein